MPMACWQIATAILVAQLQACDAITKWRNNDSDARPHKDHAYHSQPIRQELQNVGDLQYTLPLDVGGQAVSAIPDTGSFDLLVFSTRCVKCGDTSQLFDDMRSDTYNSSDMDAEQTFGSGKTESVEAFDAIGLGSMRVEDQVFWEVVDADMPLLAKATFQAILGVGPPLGATKIADTEAAGMQAEVDKMQAEGSTVPEGYLETVHHYAEVAKHVRNQTPVLKRLRLQSFSVCLLREPGSPGVWIWRDNAVQMSPSLFSTVPVKGDTYWSVELRSVRLGLGRGATTAVSISDAGRTELSSASAAPVQLGCSTERCLGVVDTGTSFLVMPSASYKLVVEAIESWREQGSDCSDLSQLPNLEFKLGDKDFSLPPESYVGQMIGELPVELWSYMPHAKAHNRPNDNMCTPLLMATDEESADGAVWILGLPVFRKYYTTFTLEEGSETGRSMSFALADPQCQPQRAEQLYREADIHRKPVRIDASKIRLPRFGSGRTRIRRIKEELGAKEEAPRVTRTVKEEVADKAKGRRRELA